MKPFINCDGCCDYCLATECDYRKTESLTYATTQDDITKKPIKTEDKQMKKDKDNFIAAVEKAKQRLASGEKPEDVFDDYDDFYEGFARVQLNNKYNFINSDCKLLSNTWFDFCWNFQKGLAWVKLGGKWNYIDCNGNFLSTIWFDDCRCFRNGFALVKLNGVDYLLRKDGVLCNYGTKEPIELGYSVSNIDYKKKYEEALERARVVNPGTADHNIVTAIFPELQESDENKIIDALKVAVHAYCSTDHNYVTTIPKNQLIAWLEKQGELVNSLSKGLDNAHERIDGLIQKNNSLIEQLEKQGKQKPTDKVEPKFKVGDFIVRNYKKTGAVIYKVVSVKQIDNETYGYDLDDGTYFSGSFEREYHLWTIQDAKEGDVLCYEDEVFILKNYVLFHKIVYHCCYDGKNLVSHSIYSLTKDDFNKIHPATEEQRDLLFSKMKEAGYYWYAENKELKKIEQEDDSELTDFESALFSAFSDAWQEYLSGKTVNIAKWTREHSAELLEVARKQKPTDWSEEDERICACLINAQEKELENVKKDKYGHSEIVSDLKEMYRERIDWLESVKKRMKEE